MYVILVIVVVGWYCESGCGNSAYWCGGGVYVVGDVVVMIGWCCV